ncbi:MAG TPA: GNAT family N-acetyltransferase [Jiangellaceae bacterium]|nr:GNAT family N-acetyltransferase [Jiangellaceae bacterium]
MVIRPATEADESALYDVCLRTGAEGEDATGTCADPRLLGHVYVGPYLALQPDLAFVLDDGRPAGYALGALDTEDFDLRCEREWWPALRERYPDPPSGGPWTPDERAQYLIHHPPRMCAAVLAEYPAHLHIDLLPRAQGAGNGRRLITRLLDEMRSMGAPGVHLVTGTSNRRAIGFYDHLGFHTMQTRDGAVVMAKRLSTG